MKSTALPLVLIVLLGILIGIFWFVRLEEQMPNVEQKEKVKDWDLKQKDGLKDQESLTKISCESSGGQWNACGSACRETPDAACIQVCVAYCECGEDTDCPQGYACDGFVNGIGVCKMN